MFPIDVFPDGEAACCSLRSDEPITARKKGDFPTLGAYIAGRFNYRPYPRNKLLITDDLVKNKELA